MARKKTPEEIEAQKKLEQDVKKELRNIKRRKKRLEERGYSVPETTIPTMPKNITGKTLAAFKRRDINYFYKRAVYVDAEGVKKKGYERRKEEYSERSKKGAETRRKFAEERGAKISEDVRGSTLPPVKEAETVIKNTLEQIETVEGLMFVLDNREINERWWEHRKDPLGLYKEYDYHLLRATIEGAIAKEGIAAVAERIQQNATLLNDLINSVLKDSGDAYHKTGRTGMNQKIQAIAEILAGRPLNVEESRYFTEEGEREGFYET